jgi:MurNAc alpha-1-phosphate uridylyltransferase
MILAAGRGERLRPLTDEMPKSLVEVRGEALIERHLNGLRAAGVETVVVNLGWLGDKVLERIGPGDRFGLNVIYSNEGDDILETGGGIHRALPMLGEEPFLVVNADIYTDMPFSGIGLEAGDLAHLVLVPTPADNDAGDFALEGDRIRNSGDELLTFSGVSVYRPEFFAGCTPGRFSVVPLLRTAADAGRVSGSVYAGLWRDAGTPARLAELQD